jgi:formylglycine-generating enzyme required for sulfatase activity
MGPLPSFRPALVVLPVACALLLDSVASSEKQITNSIGMKLVRIPAGKFLMGSPTTEAGRNSDEPQHEVEITKDFWLGAYEVTQKQFEAVMRKNPSWFSAAGKGKEQVKGMSTGDFPVENLSWDDALGFFRKLSALPAEKKAGRLYRLPTEAEWEYACRAGTKTVFHFGASLSSTQANFEGNFPYGGAPKGPSLNRTCKVGSYKPNAYGLYDMHGNVDEWCIDWYASDYYSKSPRRDPSGPDAGTARVVRGGAWRSHGVSCRSAIRGERVPAYRGHDVGFRVVMVQTSR